MAAVLEGADARRPSAVCEVGSREIGDRDDGKHRDDGKISAPDPAPAFVRRRSDECKAGLDGLAWLGGLIAAWLLQSAGGAGPDAWRDLLAVAAALVAVHWVVGAALGLYRGRWVFGSFDEVRALATAIGGTVVIVAAVGLATKGLPIRLATVVAGGACAFVTMGAVRGVWRTYAERRRRPAADGRRILVFGAGEGGFWALRTMLHDPDTPFVPVALLDDDPQKQNLEFMGVRVVGTRHSLAAVAAAYGASGLLVAVPSADGKLVRELMDLAIDAGIDMQVLPTAKELFSGSRVIDIRRPTEADLLGRRLVETDVDMISEYLRDRRVLVTGAGGSIGSELCRLIARFEPAELIMVDRDESSLHAVQLSLEGHGLLDSPNVLLADLRDRQRVFRLFAERRPHVVFHAAALKHLPLLEFHPSEALKTNVWGTLAVLEAAAAVDVECLVNISTDKAADPTSVLGYSKRITERLAAHVGATASGHFLSVRFGNVLGSRGSVLTSLRSQIAAGGPVTVTHPDISRFFMTVEEAVELVLQGVGVGRDGEVLVLDMGEPVRIDDLARTLIARSGRDIEIVYTGLRPAEKLHEALIGTDEIAVRREHPLIMHAAVPPLDPELVRYLDSEQPNVRLAAVLADLASAPPSSLNPATAALTGSEAAITRAVSGAILSVRPAS